MPSFDPEKRTSSCRGYDFARGPTFGKDDVSRMERARSFGHTAMRCYEFIRTEHGEPCDPKTPLTSLRDSDCPDTASWKPQASPTCLPNHRMITEACRTKGTIPTQRRDHEVERLARVTRCRWHGVLELNVPPDSSRLPARLPDSSPTTFTRGRQ